MKDPIAVLEAAYLWDRDQSTWLQSVSEAVSSNFDFERGLAACVYDARRADWVDVRNAAFLETSPRLVADLFHNDVRNSRELRKLVQMFRRTSVGTMKRAISNTPESARHYDNLMAREALRDMFCINARNPTHVGCLFVVPSSTQSRLAPRAIDRWRRLAAHIAAGFRVREQLARWREEGGDPLGAPEAVLRPDGSLMHAEPAATGRSSRALLRDAVRAIDRARTTEGRQSPDEALDVWQGLVDGRWSLVDYFDADGKRFVLAHRNEPDVADPRALSGRERVVVSYAALGHSNKQIAYELGLAPSTVAMTVARARKKLGAAWPVVLRALLESELAPAPGEDNS